MCVCVCVWGGGGGGAVSKVLIKVLNIYFLSHLSFIFLNISIKTSPGGGGGCLDQYLGIGVPLRVETLTCLEQKKK